MSNEENIKPAQTKQLNIAGVRTRFVIALETTDDIIKGKKYELKSVDEDGLFYHIIDESNEETAYYHSVLNEC